MYERRLSQVTYSDDPLRMMRAIRFRRSNFTIEEASRMAITWQKERIEIVWKERITRTQ